MGLVQLSQRNGQIERVPDGDIPLVELHLEPNQRVVSLDLCSRSTVDWSWTAVIETRLGDER